jgi:hypothetical protein
MTFCIVFGRRAAATLSGEWPDKNCPKCRKIGLGRKKQDYASGVAGKPQLH